MQNEKITIDLRTGEGKRTWYGYVLIAGEFVGELTFIDKIHYEYLRTILPAQNKQSVKVQ